MSIEANVGEIMLQCSDKHMRLAVTELLVTDVGRRRQIRRAEALSKRLLQDAKDAIHRMHVLPEGRKEKERSGESHSAIYIYIYTYSIQKKTTGIYIYM